MPGGAGIHRQHVRGCCTGGEQVSKGGGGVRLVSCQTGSLYGRPFPEVSKARNCSSVERQRLLAGFRDTKNTFASQETVDMFVCESVLFPDIVLRKSSLFPFLGRGGWCAGVANLARWSPRSRCWTRRSCWASSRRTTPRLVSAGKVAVRGLRGVCGDGIFASTLPECGRQWIVGW